MNDDQSLSSIDLDKFLATYLEGIRTESFTFENNTTAWDIGWWVYEARQTQHLPPPAGYIAYTGVVVGGTNCAPGQTQTAQLTVNVIGHFADCGLVNLKNRSNGKFIAAYNFPDRPADPGNYWRQLHYGIKDGPALDSVDWEITGTRHDGSTFSATGSLKT